MTGNARILARRYARALGLVSAPIIDSELIDRLDTWSADWGRRSPLVSFLRLECLADATKINIINESAQQQGVDTFLRDIIRVLAQHKRLWLIGEVIREYVAWYRVVNRIEEVEVRTTDALSEEELAVIRSWIMRRTGAFHVRMHSIIDKTLIAGIRLKSSTFLWEHSVRQQLYSLAELC